MSRITEAAFYAKQEQLRLSFTDAEASKAALASSWGEDPISNELQISLMLPSRPIRTAKLMHFKLDMPPSLRILVAENNPDDAFFLRCAFEQAESDASIHFVRDGQELVDYLRGDPPFGNRILYPFPGMVLLDLALPRVDGFGFLAWLQKEPRLKDLVVVILTGSDQPADFERACGLGAVEYLIKPQSPLQLVAIVRRLEQLWRELNAQPTAAEPAILRGTAAL